MNKTLHTESCMRVFSNYDLSCPRCQELANGAKARKGWSNNRALAEAQQLRAIALHFAPGGRADQIQAAGGMDTAFQW